MARKSGNYPQHFAVKIETPPPSDPTVGLIDLHSTTIALRRRLDALEERNRAVQPTVERIARKPKS